MTESAKDKGIVAAPDPRKPSSNSTTEGTNSDLSLLNRGEEKEWPNGVDGNHDENAEDVGWDYNKEEGVGGGDTLKQEKEVPYFPSSSTPHGGSFDDENDDDDDSWNLEEDEEEPSSLRADDGSHLQTASSSQKRSSSSSRNPQKVMKKTFSRSSSHMNGNKNDASYRASNQRYRPQSDSRSPVRSRSRNNNVSDVAKQNSFVSIQRDRLRIEELIDEARGFLVLSAFYVWRTALAKAKQYRNEVDDDDDDGGVISWFFIFEGLGVTTLCFLSAVPPPIQDTENDEFSVSVIRMKAKDEGPKRNAGGVISVCQRLIFSRKGVLLVVYILAWMYLCDGARFMFDEGLSKEAALRVLKGGKPPLTHSTNTQYLSSTIVKSVPEAKDATEEPLPPASDSRLEAKRVARRVAEDAFQRRIRDATHGRKVDSNIDSSSGQVPKIGYETKDNKLSAMEIKRRKKVYAEVALRSHLRDVLVGKHQVDKSAAEDSLKSNDETRSTGVGTQEDLNANVEIQDKNIPKESVEDDSTALEDNSMSSTEISNTATSNENQQVDSSESWRQDVRGENSDKQDNSSYDGMEASKSTNPPQTIVQIYFLPIPDSTFGSREGMTTSSRTADRETSILEEEKTGQQPLTFFDRILKSINKVFLRLQKIFGGKNYQENQRLLHMILLSWMMGSRIEG